MVDGAAKDNQGTTVGYRYFMALHMGLCRGPIDEIVQINVGDVRAFPVPDGNSETVSGLMTVAEGPGGSGVAQYEDGTSEVVGGGSINTIRSTVETSINAPTLFGGDKKEGGIQGSLSVLMGASTQIVPSWIKSMMGGLVPDFRGVATLFYNGLLTSLNPYPKKWQFRVRRTVSGWDGDVWQPSLATIWLRNGTVKAMNGAHIVYECITNRDWGRGYPRSTINEASFLAAAQKLYDEQLGLCLRWNRQDDLGTFVQQVIDHIGGSLYQDRTTGLFNLSLLRGDYDPDDLPTFTYDSGLLLLEDDETTAQDEIINEMVVDWQDPIQNKARQSRVHNLASVQTVGAINNSKASYKGAPTSELALRLGQRDLKANANSLKRYKVHLDRRAWKAIPGAVFKISAPDKNIFSVVLRAGKVTDGTMESGKIIVDGVLDVFGLPSASFISTPPSQWTPPDRSAVIPTQRKVREGTYRDLVRSVTPADLALVDPLSSAIATVVGKPTPLSQGYNIASRVGSDPFVNRSAAVFAPTAILSAAIDLYDTEIAFTGGIDLGLVEVGDQVEIGGEIMRLDNISTTDGVVGTMTVARGCIDTIPKSHDGGSVIFVSEGAQGSDLIEYALGDTVDIKALTYTSTAELSAALAPTDTIAILARQGRPWAPGDVRVNGTPYGDAGNIPGTINLSWAHRDRTLIQDQLLEHGAGSVGPEAGVTYTVRSYSSPGSSSPARTVTGLTGTTWSYTGPMMIVDGITDTVTLELEAVRDGLTSFEKYRFTVSHTPEGYGTDYGARYGG